MALSVLVRLAYPNQFADVDHDLGAWPQVKWQPMVDAAVVHK
jgi:hypothetical protein